MKRWPCLGDAAATGRRRADLWRLLRLHPALAMQPAGTQISTRATALAHVENWTLAVNSEEPVPALLLRPLNQAPCGLVLCCHAHGNRFEVGKDELLLGRPALQKPRDGEVLARLGSAVLAIDHWCFGERNFGGVKSERAMAKRLLWEGKTLWGFRVHDTLASLTWARMQPNLADLPVRFCAGLTESLDGGAIGFLPLKENIEKLISSSYFGGKRLLHQGYSLDKLDVDYPKN